MRKRTLSAAIALWIVLELTGCIDNQPDKVTPPPTTNNPTLVAEAKALDPFRDQLLNIAQEYEAYKYLLRENMIPGPYLCRLVKNVGVSRDIMQISRSGDEMTHGRKLYL